MKEFVSDVDTKFLRQMNHTTTTQHESREQQKQLSHITIGSKWSFSTHKLQAKTTVREKTRPRRNKETKKKSWDLLNLFVERFQVLTELCDFPIHSSKMQPLRFHVRKGLKDLSLLLFILRMALQHLTDLQAHKHRLKLLSKAKRYNEKNTRVKRKCIRIFMQKLNGKWFQIHGAVGWFGCWRGKFSSYVTIF